MAVKILSTATGCGEWNTSERGIRWRRWGQQPSPFFWILKWRNLEDYYMAGKIHVWLLHQFSSHGWFSSHVTDYSKWDNHWSTGIFSKHGVELPREWSRMPWKEVNRNAFAMWIHCVWCRTLETIFAMVSQVVKWVLSHLSPLCMTWVLSLHCCHNCHFPLTKQRCYQSILAEERIAMMTNCAQDLVLRSLALLLWGMRLESTRTKDPV